MGYLIIISENPAKPFHVGLHNLATEFLIRGIHIEFVFVVALLPTSFPQSATQAGTGNMLTWMGTLTDAHRQVWIRAQGKATCYFSCHLYSLNESRKSHAQQQQNKMWLLAELTVLSCYPKYKGKKKHNSFCVLLLLRQAVITRGTSAAQHCAHQCLSSDELPFTQDFQPLRPEVDTGITGANLATVHPSLIQLPLMSVHRWGRENQHWFLFHTQAAAPFSSAVLCQQRTKLVKPHIPLIIICFLT